MKIALAFAPFIAFAVLSHSLEAEWALIGAAMVSFGLIIRGMFKGEQPKLLEVATVTLFVILAGFVSFGGRDLERTEVRLIVDGGVLAIVLLTIAIGRPFTAQYAREEVNPADWDSPVFKRTTFYLAVVWAVILTAILAVEGGIALSGDLPEWLGTVASVFALLTGWRITDTLAADE